MEKNPRWHLHHLLHQYWKLLKHSWAVHLNEDDYIHFINKEKAIKPVVAFRMFPMTEPFAPPRQFAELNGTSYISFCLSTSTTSTSPPLTFNSSGTLPTVSSFIISNVRASFLGLSSKKSCQLQKLKLQRKEKSVSVKDTTRKSLLDVLPKRPIIDHNSIFVHSQLSSPLGIFVLRWRACLQPAHKEKSD